MCRKLGLLPTRHFSSDQACHYRLGGWLDPPLVTNSVLNQAFPRKGSPPFFYSLPLGSALIMCAPSWLHSEQDPHQLFSVVEIELSHDVAQVRLDR